jgi:hypothetical protein
MTTPEYLESIMDGTNRQRLLEYIRGLIGQAASYTDKDRRPFDPSDTTVDFEKLGKIVLEAGYRLAGIYFDENGDQIQAVIDGNPYPAEDRFDNEGVETDDG